MAKEKQTEALAAPVNTGLAAMPSYLTASEDGREQISPDDLSLPRLMVANSLTEKVQEGLLKVGSLYDSVAGNVLFEPGGKPLRGVFLAARRQRTRFRPKGSGNGIECHSPNGSRANQPNGLVRGVATDNCSVCEYGQFTKNADGSISKPACNEYRELLYLFEGFPLPLVVAFGKSTSKIGKKLVEKLNADMGMSGRPIYAFAYELESVLMESKGNKWWALKYRASGYPSEELYVAAKAQYDKHRESLRTLTAAGLQGDADAEAAPADDSPPV